MPCSVIEWPGYVTQELALLPERVAHLVMRGGYLPLRATRYSTWSLPSYHVAIWKPKDKRGGDNCNHGVALRTGIELDSSQPNNVSTCETPRAIATRKLSISPTHELGTCRALRWSWQWYAQPDPREAAVPGSNALHWRITARSVCHPVGTTSFAAYYRDVLGKIPTHGKCKR